jgi:exonuclease VII large subunit
MELTAAANRLAGLNPKSVLSRGYSITSSKKTGLLIKTSEEIEIGDYLITEIKGENLIESKVTKK